MAAIDKKELVRRKRKERADKGLVECKVYIKPDQRAKLAAYVSNRLQGEYRPVV